MKIKFLRWVMGWAQILEGICAVLTLGFWTPALSLRVARRIAQVRMNIEYAKRTQEMIKAVRAARAPAGPEMRSPGY